MVKLTYIISDINRALAFEWVAQYINKDKFLLSFILLNEGKTELEDFLKERGITTYQVNCGSKKDWPSAFYKCYKLLKEINSDVVHCHLISANIIGLSAAKLAGIKKRIYTRHHSSLHHIYFKKGIWWDKLANKLATHIVAISGIVKKILIEWERADAKKIVVIPHGFLFEEFTNVTEHRISSFQKRHQLSDTDLIVGVISRFTEWKGIQYIIPAFKQFLAKYPDSVLLLLNAKGEYESEIKSMLSALPKESYRLIPFENDIGAAYKRMSMVIHVPVDNHSEAFGQVYVEALIAGTPPIFTRSGIANDTIFNNDVAWIVDYKNSHQIYESMINILENKEEVTKRRAVGWQRIQHFNLGSFINELEKLYQPE